MGNAIEIATRRLTTWRRLMLLPWMLLGAGILMSAWEARFGRSGAGFSAVHLAILALYLVSIIGMRVTFVRRRQAQKALDQAKLEALS